MPNSEMVGACRPPQDNPKTLNTQLYIQLYEKKLKRFEQFAKLYPECYWVFVGDNGQVGFCVRLRDSALCVDLSALCMHMTEPFCIHCFCCKLQALLSCRTASCLLLGDLLKAS